MMQRWLISNTTVTHHQTNHSPWICFFPHATRFFVRKQIHTTKQYATFLVTLTNPEQCFGSLRKQVDNHCEGVKAMQHRHNKNIHSQQSNIPGSEHTTLKTKTSNRRFTFHTHVSISFFLSFFSCSYRIITHLSATAKIKWIGGVQPRILYVSLTMCCFSNPRHRCGTLTQHWQPSASKVSPSAAPSQQQTCWSLPSLSPNSAEGTDLILVSMDSTPTGLAQTQMTTLQLLQPFLKTMVRHHFSAWRLA